MKLLELQSLPSPSFPPKIPPKFCSRGSAELMFASHHSLFLPHFHVHWLLLGLLPERGRRRQKGCPLVLKKGRLGESYNIGGINEWANIDIVNLLCEQIDQLFADYKDYRIQYPDCPCSKGQSAKTLITHVTDRLGHDRRYAIDAHKIMTELGYKPKDSFETGIAKTIRWYLDHHEWWFKLVK